MAYQAKDITVLKGLEPVRERPGMYIGSTGITGLHHLVYEVVDNSVDEAMAGEATKIDVVLLADGGCRVTDNGRGIPVDNHPEYKGKSAAEVVLTVLHAGGKFGGEGYKISGGLHGVGVSVVNALSSRLDLEIHRDGSTWTQHFAKGGKPQDKLTQGQAIAEAAARPSRSGPTPRSSRRPSSSAPRHSWSACGRWRSSTRASRSNFRDERVDPVLDQQFKYSGGITDFVKHLNESKEPLFKRVVAYNDTGDNYEVDVAMQWNTGYYEGIHSFANNIATTEGGMHEEGFKKALTNVVNRYAKGKGLLKDKEDNLLGEDIREGLTAIVSVKLRNPQFEGQTKAKLGNTEMRSVMEKVTNEKLADWLEEHPTEARLAVGKASQAARARMAARQARDLTRRKSLLESSAMPGKLADCSSKNAELCELFIVEGDSAGGPAKKARNPEFQAILPIRGKILNIERARARSHAQERGDPGADLGHRHRARRRVRHLEVALPQDRADDRRRCRRRAHPHVAAHVLLPPVRRARARGKVYVAQPPLFRADLGKERNYLKDEAALTAFEADHEGRKIEVSRFKGLGEMDWQELGETTMDPAHALAAAGVGRRRRHCRRRVLTPHGRRRRVAQALHPGQRERRPVRRRLEAPDPAAPFMICTASEEETSA